MAEHDYTEVIISKGTYAHLTQNELGMLVAGSLAKGKPVLVRVTDDVNPKPWATDNENNFNRRGTGK